MTSKKTKAFADITLGEKLPEQQLPITVTLVAGGAIATRDYVPVHHDVEAARAQGAPNVFMNILTTSALVQGFIEQWSGPQARFSDLKIKLGAPNYPGDSMTFSGEVSERDETTKRIVVTLKGRNSMGNHVTGSVTVALP
ncbi:MaoC family dehydratase [Pseudomonas sp. MTM4]|uniref:MaoC family dehydratase n=1 Tax=unclassified Pseudomonas TaxID=196821 RepID=UPI0018D23944|nr:MULTISPECIES: MaoC family dehydratase [unclassified Pseudomonas]MBC8651958.1 acyl dehydratase [Pseudomonas sp. MT4]QXY91241.1 MaoC family dehydratase [Pseudomonas sp. MTM4]